MGPHGGSRIAELLEERRDEILRRFVGRARHAGAAAALSDEEVIDQLSEFLDELAPRLRAGSAATGQSTAATVHGEHRFLHGYDLLSLVREYDALRELLWDVIIEDGRVPLREIQTFFGIIFEGLADAAARYANLRDAELRRQSSEHLAFLAHELRNPISTAVTAATLLRSRGEAKPSRALDAIVRSLAKTAQLIDDSLVTLRLQELGHLERAPVDLADLVRECIADTEAEAEAKSLRVVCVVDGETKVDADRRTLGSALSNLIRNAVKFSRPSTEVVVRIRAIDSRKIVEVEDSCGGLPPGAEQKVFDPFVQAGADRSGFGLGLAIAKQATEAHNGQLRVHSLSGKGCVFLLELPAHPS